MPYSFAKCILGTYTYAHNPTNGSPNPVVPSVNETVGLAATITTDWGVKPSDRVIEQNWDFMLYDQYFAIEAIVATGGIVTFVDEFSRSFSVKITAWTVDGWTLRSRWASGVKLTMRVQP